MDDVFIGFLSLQSSKHIDVINVFLTSIKKLGVIRNINDFSFDSSYVIQREFSKME